MTHLTKITLLSLLLFRPLFGDIIGGEVSLGYYNHAPSGNALYTTPLTGTASSADLEDTLGWSDAQDVFLKAYFEHPLPFIPNVKLGFTKLSHDGTGAASLFSWGDIVNFSGEINSQLDLRMTDVTLYYELLDNWIELDAGLTGRYLSGDIQVDTVLESENVSFSSWIPMLYAKARFNVPSTDFSLQFEANGISYQGATFYDYELSARYTLAVGLGLEAGYKAFHVDSDDLSSGLESNMDFTGAYAAVVWDF
ncbi:MAG TPA: TIGR04219 family outer membrane beta-barrel protein [Epsilonproteobacteria bacterium]|nr:TIGR04219 family outer membrane beta-barrel protein [Campylobacterota bacterium]